MNPYEPPLSDTKNTPYWKRFRRALERALREYRTGLLRDNISRGQHLRSWLAVFGLFFMAALFCVLFVLSLSHQIRAFF